MTLTVEQQEVKPPPTSPPGNPDEIWIRRLCDKKAYKIWVSDLVEKRYTDVSGLCKQLTEEFPSWKDVDPTHIYIYKHGQEKWLVEETPVAELAGNTRQTPHIVEVEVGKR